MAEKEIIKKLAFIYWFETATKSGWKLSNKQKEMYDQIKSEVMEYGYDYFEDSGS